MTAAPVPSSGLLPNAVGLLVQFRRRVPPPRPLRLPLSPLPSAPHAGALVLVRASLRVVLPALLAALFLGMLPAPPVYPPPLWCSCPRAWLRRCWPRRGRPAWTWGGRSSLAGCGGGRRSECGSPAARREGAGNSDREGDRWRQAGRTCGRADVRADVREEGGAAHAGEGGWSARLAVSLSIVMRLFIRPSTPTAAAA